MTDTSSTTERTPKPSRKAAAAKAALKAPPGKRIFVLDTNVLMHDPTALFRFEEHDVHLPMMVLEELDAGKKGMSETARNVRQVSRFIDAMLTDGVDIREGLPLNAGVMLGDGFHKGGTPECHGRLFFQSEPSQTKKSAELTEKIADNKILAYAHYLQDAHQGRPVTVVSKDINLRIKASVLEINTEDYRNDRVIEDVDLLFSGETELDSTVWDRQGDSLKAWQKDGDHFYEFTGELAADWQPRQCITLATDPEGDSAVETTVVGLKNGAATLRVVDDFRETHSVWGVNARNSEQNYALNLLLDPDVDFVTLVGQAGTGKTLLTLAAALAQTLDEKRYREIIMTRVTVPLADDIGFLPGTEEEKMTPWMGALMDNLEVLTESDEGGTWGQKASQDIIGNRIKVRSVNFMRGRTFLNRFIIVDEAQNLTPKQMKALITRAGPGTKMVCLGNVAQIDTPYLTETTSGLTYVVNNFRPWEHSAHITLKRGERSRLADYANGAL